MTTIRRYRKALRAIVDLRPGHVPSAELAREALRDARGARDMVAMFESINAAVEEAQHDIQRLHAEYLHNARDERAKVHIANAGAMIGKARFALALSFEYATGTTAHTREVFRETRKGGGSSE